MRNKANKFGLIFLAAASVYSGQATRIAQADNARGTASARGATSDAPGTTAGTVGPGFYFAKAATPAPAAAPTVDTAATPTPMPSPAGLVVDTAAPAPTPTPADAPIPVDNTAGGTNPAQPIDPFAAQNPSGAATQGRSVTNDDVEYNGAAGTVEIHVNDANLVEVLRMLSLQSQKNIIASKEVKGTVTANLYGVTVREALDAILTSNGYTFREDGNFIYVYTAQELQAQRDASRIRKTQVFRLYYTPVSTAVNMIKPVLSKDGEVAFTEPAHVGLESGSGDAGGNSHSTEDVMVVTDFEDNLTQVQHVLSEIDKRPQQILIEATILRATLNEDNALGIDFQVLGGVDFSGLTASKTSAGALAGGGIQNVDSASGIVEHGAVGAGTGFTNNVPSGGLQVGVVKNNIAVFLEALETVTDTTVLANPKILALNKQKGEVIVGREDGYVTSTTTDTATVQTVEFLQTGTRLIFRPYIGDDGFVRMEIHPEDSSGGLTGANLPFKVTTEVTSNVLVRDGHTVVIGGLFREDSNSTRGQVPGLGNIPFAGALFRSQRDRTTREEIIILLTPHIVKDDAAYSQMSQEEMQRMEQLRVGVRRGMMPSGRERLAEGFYDAAVSELAKPNPNRGLAMWNLNAASNLNPKFLEAIELRQQLTGHTVTSVDNAIARDFVRQMAMRDLATQRLAPHHTVPMQPVTPPPTTAPTTMPMDLPPVQRPDLRADANQAPATQPTVVTTDAAEQGEVTIWPSQDNAQPRPTVSTTPAGLVITGSH